MNDTFAEFCVCFIFAWCLALGLMTALGTRSRPYMNGQIDALTGKIHWELQEQEDKSIDWIFIKDRK